MDQTVRTGTPETLEDIAGLQHDIAALIRQMSAIDEAAQKECAPILKRAGKKTAPLRRRVLTLAREIDAYARAHRDELTNRGKKKTSKVPGGGELQWRKSKPAVHLSDEEAVLAYLVSRGIEVFIRRTPSVNKTAMADHPIKAARIPGVTIRPNRKFIIELPTVKERIERPSTSKRLEIVRPRSRE